MNRCWLSARQGAVWAVLLLSSTLFARASITLDATSQATGATGTTVLTWNHTLGTGSSRLVVCSVSIATPDAAVAAILPSVTFNGVAMTAIPGTQAPTHSQSSTAKIFTELFYIPDASLPGTSGTYSVVATLPTAPTGGVVGGCASLFGAGQSGPEATGTAYSGNGTATPISLTTTTAGDWVIDSFAGGYTSGKTAAPATGQTSLFNTAITGTTTAGSSYGALGGASYEAVASPGSVSVTWTENMSRFAYAAAAFPPSATVNYTVSTSVSPANAGSVSLSPSQSSYPSGTNVLVTASAQPGYTFTGFSGDLTSTTSPATLNVTKNDSVVANFAVAQCTLTVNIVGSGTVTPSTGSQYACGTQVPITATAANGYSFGGFSGGLSGTTNPQTLTLNSNTTVTATFIQGTACTLSTSVTGQGTIAVSPTGSTFSCGTSITVSATPASGLYSFTGFSGLVTGTTNPQTFILNTSGSITAAFTQTKFLVNLTTVGPGTVSPTPNSGGYAPGTQVILTATPNSGAYFVGFTGDQTGSSPLTFTVNGTTNLTATFANAAITLDATSKGISTAATTSTVTWQHTLGSGINRALVIAVGEADSAASPDPYSVVQSVTFNGIYATPIPNSTVYGGTSGNVQTQLFYLLDSELPTAGTYTVQVNLAGSIGGISAGAVSLFGVSQGPPEAVTTGKATTGVNLISTSITTLTNNAWVVDVLEDGDTTTLAANSGQTIAWQGSAKLGTGGSSYEAVPTAGPVTLGWSGTANRLVQSLAAFPPAVGAAPATHVLTTSVTGAVGGTVTSNPGLSSYPVSTGVLLTATPAVGYAFSGWSGDYTSTTNPLPITMDTDRNVVATFTTAATCTITVNIVGSGTLNIGSGTYNCGTVLHLVATAGDGYTFTSFSGDFASVDNPADFTLSANSTVTVEFDPVPMCALNVATTGHGTVSPGSGSYACGTTVSLTATAANGYAFSGFTGDLTTTANPAILTLNQDTSITAAFTQGAACTLTTTVVGQGTISPSSGSYACGTQITVQAIPAAKYIFSGFSGDLTGVVTPTTLTLSTNKSVTATFTVNTSGVTGDPRTVTEPSYPPVCTVLTAVQSVSAPVETSPDTVRVQAALNACAVGQAVEFAASADGSANAFLIQPITLPAGVTMLVDPEVTILGSIKSTDYACISAESWCTPLIDVAANTAPAPGSAIMGLGVIDGRGGTALTDLKKSWWATGSNARPRLIFLNSHSNTAPADNFTMYKITLKNSPKFEFSGIGNNLTIWGIKVYAPPDSPNTDGVDPSASQNITITNSYISDGDDMIAMKAGNGHVANVTISNNHMYSGHGITVGSETNAGLNNMLVVNDAIDNGFGGSSVDSLRIKSDTSRGGEVYDVLYKNICINHGGDTIVIDPYYSSQAGNLIPNFHDITFSNVHELIRDSSHKSTMTGYNTNGIINPLTVTLDNVQFDGAVANDFKAPDNFNNVQFTFGPGPVNVASLLTADAAVPTNYITVTNSISNSNAALDCSTAFVYLAGDLTAHTSQVAGGSSATLIAVLQNLVSPLVAGTISYPQQNLPTGTIQLLEGSTVVASATIGTGARFTKLVVPAVAQGSHTYTAQYTGDSHYAPLSFGSFIVQANAAPVANNQSVSVNYNTATPIILTATGSGTLTYTLVSSPAHGTLTGTAPSLIYTPAAGYSGGDSFTFKANNGGDSNTATVSITVLTSGSGQQSQTITFAAPASPVTYGVTGVTLGATASSNLPVTYSVTGPAAVNGGVLSYTGQGQVMITASQAGSSSYSAAAPVSYIIQVLAANLNVGVQGSPTRIFGTPNPPFLYTLGTFVNGDLASTAVTGSPVLSTAAVPKSAAGPYPIVVTSGTLTATNYVFTPVNGQLLVTGGAAQTILFPPLPPVGVGKTLQLVAMSTSGLPVTLQVTQGSASLSGSLLTVQGAGTIQVTATQPGDGNFSAAAPVTRTFTAQ